MSKTQRFEEAKCCRPRGGDISGHFCEKIFKGREMLTSLSSDLPDRLRVLCQKHSVLRRPAVAARGAATSQPLCGARHLAFEPSARVSPTTAPSALPDLAPPRLSPWARPLPAPFPDLPDRLRVLCQKHSVLRGPDVAARGAATSPGTFAKRPGDVDQPLLGPP